MKWLIHWWQKRKATALQRQLNAAPQRQLADDMAFGLFMHRTTYIPPKEN
jgi:hypothetical protein